MKIPISEDCRRCKRKAELLKLFADNFDAAFTATGKNPKDKAAKDVFFLKCLLLLSFGVFT